MKIIEKIKVEIQFLSNRGPSWSWYHRMVVGFPTTCAISAHHH